MNLQTIIFTGRSGCGKGTQIERLKEYISENDERSVFHLEAGNKFREFIEKPYYASQVSKEIYSRGGLQPEFLSVWAWGEELAHNFKENQHLFIDGTPRRVSEAKILESAFEFFDRPTVHVVYLNVSRDWAKERMHERGRIDDRKIEDVVARLDWFDTDVIPVIDFYRSHKSHKFHDINGEQEIEKIHQDILKALEL